MGPRTCLSYRRCASAPGSIYTCAPPIRQPSISFSSPLFSLSVLSLSKPLLPNIYLITVTRELGYQNGASALCEPSIPSSCWMTCIIANILGIYRTAIISRSHAQNATRRSNPNPILNDMITTCIRTKGMCSVWIIPSPRINIQNCKLEFTRRRFPCPVDGCHYAPTQHGNLRLHMRIQ